MIQDPLFTLTLTLAVATLAGLAMLCGATLRGWRGWLDLKRAELERGMGVGEPALRLPSAERIEMADLKERIRKLEAIAAGVDP
jgi:hypothetical protein